MAASERLDRAGNLLGALSIAITDRTIDAIADAAEVSETAAIALSALHHFLDEPSVDRLRQVLGLTPSGTVRLVDRLEVAGLVTRRPGVDARSVAVVLTPAGRRAAQRVSAARGDVLQDALAVLSPAERATLDDLVGRVLVGLIRELGATRWTCRLCDMEACGRDRDECLVAVAAFARFGRAPTPD